MSIKVGDNVVIKAPGDYENVTGKVVRLTESRGGSDIAIVQTEDEETTVKCLLSDLEKITPQCDRENEFIKLTRQEFREVAVGLLLDSKAPYDAITFVAQLETQLFGLFGVDND